MTGTAIVQPVAGIDAPLLYVTVGPPDAATTFPAAQVPPTVAGLPSTRFAGSVSTRSAASVRATAFVFPSVSVSVEPAPSGIDAGENDLATVGRARTWSVAEAATRLFPAVVWTAPAGTAFTYERTVVDVTSTWIVQPPFAGRAPPLR